MHCHTDIKFKGIEIYAALTESILLYSQNTAKASFYRELQKKKTHTHFLVNPVYLHECERPTVCAISLINTIVIGKDEGIIPLGW